MLRPDAWPGTLVLGARGPVDGSDGAVSPRSNTASMSGATRVTRVLAFDGAALSEWWLNARALVTTSTSMLAIVASRGARLTATVRHEPIDLVLKRI